VVSNTRDPEVVSLPVDSCGKVPNGESDEGAAFTVVAAFGLEGIRLIGARLGILLQYPTPEE
jgi:hypothetical protein